MKCCPGCGCALRPKLRDGVARLCRSTARELGECVAARDARQRTMQGADSHRAAPLPDEPTDARPGSEEKVRVLEQRARCRRQLFHPQDATFRRVVSCGATLE